MAVEPELPPVEEEWWHRVQCWFDGHWRTIALVAATVVAAVAVAILVSRLNETDQKLKRAICAEVLFLEAASTSTQDRNDIQIQKLAANLRSEVTCPARPPA
jgi:anti-sigma-K factor RskA